MKHFLRMSVLLLILALLPMAASIAAENYTCAEHEFNDVMPAQYRPYEIVEFTTVGHIFQCEKLQVCSACGLAERWVLTSLDETQYVQEHDYSIQLRDLGHTVGDRHQYVMGCSHPECGFTITLNVHCDNLCESWINRKLPTNDAE